MGLQKITWDKTTITTIIAIFSLIVTIVSVSVQFRSKTLQLNCNILSSNELTSVSEVPGLSSEFVYNKKKVSHLWKVTLNYINSGNMTLVGIGKHSVLIGDGLLFWFPTKTEILNYEVISKDIPLTVEQIGPNGFKVKFSQWKPDEKATISLYVASSSAQLSPLVPVATTRDIVGGNVIITNAMSSINSKRVPFLDKVPIVFSIMVKTILSLFCFAIFLIGFYWLPKGFINFLRRTSWLKHHSSQFKSFIQSQPNLTDANKKMYLKEPSDVPIEVWDNFKGTRYPRNDSVGFGSFSEAISFTIGFILLGGILILYTLTNIFDLYYAVCTYL